MLVWDSKIMIQRLYVNNFRCLENFELRLSEMPTALVIGKNGVGKSTLAAVLRILQSIGRETNRTGQLFKAKDFFQNRTDLPMRFQLEVLLKNELFVYVLALELPDNFREVRVQEEKLEINGKVVFSRSLAQVTLPRGRDPQETRFSVDWHFIALSLIQDTSGTNKLLDFKTWLANMVILAPIPSLMSGDATEPTLLPTASGSNFADWMSGLFRLHPASYSTVQNHARQLMPDFLQLKYEEVGRDATRMQVVFSTKSAKLTLEFEDLSSGEKCFFLYATLVAANDAYGPLFCFWDEPDNFLSMSEVGHFVLALRKEFESHGGQIVMTSHNSEAIRKFSDETIWVMDRNSHLEPAQIRLLATLNKHEDLIDALICGDVTL
jgi:predicted ATPase